VYSVCTMTRRETNDVVKTIEKQLPELERAPIVLPWKKTAATNQVWLWPQEMAGNGMFIAAWRKPRAV
ncbi:MAG TPA: hypothetical protein VN281_23195, partial [Verrucomicrobiae bacterium]|nr:hypothetical protein [Verrucomicrobiae bacterium]